MRFNTTKVLPIALAAAITFAAIAVAMFVWRGSDRSMLDAQPSEGVQYDTRDRQQSRTESEQDTAPEQEVATRDPRVTAPPEPPRYATRVEGYGVVLAKDGKTIQTIELEGLERSGAEFMMKNNIIKTPFVTDEDINFDGHADLSAAVSYGYEGRNKYYNYYVFNPKTERFVRDPLLTEVVNPRFYKSERHIWSGEISGDYSYQTIYTFNGTEYVKGDPKVVCMEEEICGD